LTKGNLKRSVAASQASGGTAEQIATGVMASSELQRLVVRDRIARKMTWPVYAQFLGVPMATVYKIARGTHTKPHELTVATILEKIRDHPVRSDTDLEGAASGEARAAAQGDR
jgi:predicted transcriptional regulator